MKKTFTRTLFFIGWMLSPFTFWNDTFVNIPLAYLAASILNNFLRMRFIVLVLICYWATNIIGLAIMYATGKSILAQGRGALRELAKLALTMAVYSAILIFLSYIGIIKPFRMG